MSRRQAIRIRKYDTYEDYINHQIRKTNLVKQGACDELTSEWDRMMMFLCQFQRHKVHIPDTGTALCLCARRGEEVAALRIMGLEAIGIDLIEFPPMVIKGDIHNLPEHDESCDFVYTNSFDHILRPRVVANEIFRVLKIGGRVMFHLQIGEWSDEQSCGIESPQEVIDLFVGMSVMSNQSLPRATGGINHLLVLRKK